MHTNLKKIAAVMGVVFATAGIAPTAHAVNEGLVQSVISIQNFVLEKGGGGILNAATDFVPGGFIIADDASVSATLNGINVQSSNPAAPPSPPLDLVQACVGPGCTFGANDYTQHTLAPTSNFARSDMQLEGVLIDGIPAVPGPGNEPFGAKANLVSEVSLISNGAGSANTTSGTSGTVTFALAQAGGVRIKFDANSWMIAYVNPAVIGRASQSLSFNLVEAATGNTVFQWAPGGSVSAGSITGGTEIADPLNLNRTLNANAVSNGPFCQPNIPGCSPVPGAGAFLSFEALTDPLAAGVQYVLTFSQTTTSTLTVLVPEPDSLALFGAMFIALGFGARVAAKRRAA